jgi:hypothetical protein
MKKTLVCLSLVALMGLSGQAMAAIGTIDAVPAATLLLPYFEVNLDDPNGLTTLFSINNASAAPAIAHVTLWTDLSIPTLDFNVFLTGYDVVTFNLRDMFTTGFLPRTRAENLPTTPFSPRGNFSLPNTAAPWLDIPSCTAQLPIGDLPPVFVDHIRRAHTGLASPTFFAGGCSGFQHGDNIARGYITIDVVNNCTLRFPDNPLYHAEDLININQIWGDYFYVDRTNEFAQGETLVHVEALGWPYWPPPGGPGLAVFGADEYTFYRRYSGGLDQREGLGSTFASRFVAQLAAGTEGGTTFQVWRDAKHSVIAPFSCALDFPSPPFPLSQHQIVIFDEQENPDVPPPGPPVSPPPPGPVGLIPFPLEAQRVEIGGLQFPVPVPFGWIYLNLNTEVTGQSAAFAAFPDAMQNWVTTVIDAHGLFSVGYDAIQLDNVTFAGQGEVVGTITRGHQDLCLRQPSLTWPAGVQPPPCP